MNGTNLSACFWSLLSTNDLKFIYIPLTIGSIKISADNTTIKDILLQHSLFEFMHPNEIELAKSDLSSFLRLKTLAGSVTRCRLQSFKSILTQKNIMQMSSSYCHISNKSDRVGNDGISWNIIDLVIYTATEDTVLAFFHNADFESYQNEASYSRWGHCQGESYFTAEDAIQLFQIFRQRNQPAPTTSMLTSLEKENPSTAELPIRIFQIVDQLNGKPLFIWPQHEKGNLVDLIQSIAKEMVLKEFKSSSFDNKQNEDISCTRHFYAINKLEFLKEHCLFQRILIPYGRLVFESFQVSHLHKYTPSYQHYFMDPTHHQNATPNRSLPVSPKLYRSYIEEYRRTRRDRTIDEVPSPTVVPSLDNQMRHSIERLNIPTKANGTILNQTHQVLSDKNATTNTLIKGSPSPTNTCSLFQKFRLDVEHVPNHSSYATASTISEKKRKTMFTQEQLQQQQVLQSMQHSFHDSVKVCARCRTNVSPEWRKSDLGPKTLCNACGLRWARSQRKKKERSDN